MPKTGLQILLWDIIPLLLALVGTNVAIGQTVWYVDDSSVNGLNDGSDWDNAFLELQSALSAATFGDEIRVAQGIYRPDYDIAAGVHTGDREMSFDLFSGLVLSGGYAGFGAVDPGFRNVGGFPTILSGDLAGDDENNFINYDENSYHVVCADSSDNNCLLDGFIVIGGNANGGDGKGGGMRIATSQLSAVGSIIRLANCTFVKNTAYYGGGIFNSHSGELVLDRCVFRSNSASGSGLYSFNTKVTLNSCIFRQNLSGACMYNYYCDVAVNNSTFWRNKTSPYQRVAGIKNYDSSLVLANCILWGNTGSEGPIESAQIAHSPADMAPTLVHCCVDHLSQYSGNGNIGDDPLFVRHGTHLRAGSPCIDLGDSSVIQDGQKDHDGESRIFGLAVDIGADEFTDTDGDELPDWWEKQYFGGSIQADYSDDSDYDGRNNLTEYVNGSNPLKGPNTCYVSLNGDDAWDGMAFEWDGNHGPKATIQAGIDQADSYEGDTVVVLPGTYTGPGNYDLDYLGKVLTVKGEDPNDLASVTETIIDCRGSVQNPHRGFRFSNFEDEDSVLSGITVCGGYADYGGAVKCENSKPIFINCVFRNNEAELGAGVYSDFGSSPKFLGCTFNRNTASLRGGGMYTREGSFSQLMGCTVSKNTARYTSGGVSANSFLTGCICWGNTDQYGSGQTSQMAEGSDAAYSYIQGWSGSPYRNSGDDPLLTGDGLHLCSDSPCIDRGLPPFLPDEYETDVDKEGRIFGDQIDIGSDEFVDSDGDALPDWWEKKHFGSSTAAFPEADPDLDGRENLLEYVESTDPFRDKSTFYVSVDGNDSWDGLLPEWDGEHGPKRTIQAGIDATGFYDGDVVVLLPGVYSGSGNRDLRYNGKAISVRSTNPSDQKVVARTIVDCEGTEENPHYGFSFGHAEDSSSVLNGITILNGYDKSYSGGSVRCYGSNPVLMNCRFSGNTGSAVVSWSASPEITNCVFSNNSGSRGAGMYNFYYSDPVIANCTFNQNVAFEGGAIFNGYYSNPIVVNTILWDNRDDNGTGEFSQIQSQDNCTPVLAHCCVQGLDTYKGYGNIGVDPLFTDPLGIDGIAGTEDDLRLRAGSPCINAGDNSAIPDGISTDLDGQPRIHACAVDMGAYENQESYFFGDADGNCIVDLDDYLDFYTCLERFGYERNPVLDACIQVFDSDGDEDVDLADFAVFQVRVGEFAG